MSMNIFKMSKSMGLAVATLLCAGCMGPLTDRMDETNLKMDDMLKNMRGVNESVSNSNDILQNEIHKDTKLLNAVNQYQAGENENIRLRTILLFLLTLDDTSALSFYAATPTLISLEAVQLQNTGQKTANTFRNVSIINGKTFNYGGRVLPTLQLELYQIFEKAAEFGIDYFTKIHMGNLYQNEKQKKEYLEKAPVLADLATVLFGAMVLKTQAPEGEIEGYDDSLRAESLDGKFLRSALSRLRIAAKLKQMFEVLGKVGSEMTRLKMLCEIRLNVSNFESLSLQELVEVSQSKKESEQQAWVRSFIHSSDKERLVSFKELQQLSKASE